MQSELCHFQVDHFSALNSCHCSLLRFKAYHPWHSGKLIGIKVRVNAAVYNLFDMDREVAVLLLALPKDDATPDI